MSSISRGKTGVIAPKSISSCFLWEIKPFCLACKDTGSFIDSPEFSTSLISGLARWKLQLYPKGRNSENKDSLSLFIHCLNSGIVTAQVTFSFLNNENMKIRTHKLSNSIFDSKNGWGWGYDEFVTQQFIMEDKNQILVDDTLKILCEISSSEPKYPVHEKPMELMHLLMPVLKGPDQSEINSITCRLKEFDDFEQIFENGNFSDITIVVGEKQFQAHKAIITSRSTVFEAMFKHDMRENKENTIDITDIKSEVMKEVLRFIYAGKVINIKQMANDLLVAAEKYCISGLKKMCVESMYKNLKVENALEFLKLADLCNAADLKSRVIEFIASNQKAIADKPEFGIFTDLHSEIQLELVRAIIAKNSPS